MAEYLQGCRFKYETRCSLIPWFPGCFCSQSHKSPAGDSSHGPPKRQRFDIPVAGTNAYVHNEIQGGWQTK